MKEKRYIKQLPDVQSLLALHTVVSMLLVEQEHRKNTEDPKREALSSLRLLIDLLPNFKFPNLRHRNQKRTSDFVVHNKIVRRHNLDT